jgi:SnoaL-like domain
VIGALTPADRWEIADLLATIAFASDTRDLSPLDRVFVSEATIDFGAGGAPREGLDEIKAGMMKTLKPLDATQHLVSTSIVTATDSGAHARTHWVAHHIQTGAAGGHRFTVAGTYEDDFSRRAKENWRLIHRTIFVSWTDGNPAVLGRAAGLPG